MRHLSRSLYSTLKSRKFWIKIFPPSLINTVHPSPRSPLYLQWLWYIWPALHLTFSGCDTFDPLSTLPSVAVIHLTRSPPYLQWLWYIWPALHFTFSGCDTLDPLSTLPSVAVINLTRSLLYLQWLWYTWPSLCARHWSLRSSWSLSQACTEVSTAARWRTSAGSGTCRLPHPNRSPATRNFQIVKSGTLNSCMGMAIYDSPWKLMM